MSMNEREDFSGREITTTSERQTSAVVARVTAEIQARSIVALKRPRDVMQFRSRLLEAAKRPSFAECAEYAKPIGSKRNEQTGEWEKKYARGPSIRFVEEALRCFGNNSSDVMVTEDDADSRTIRVTSSDLENNVTFASDITVSKQVERSKLKEGQKALGTRTNTYGDKVYIIEATEDELATKQAANASKAIRTNGARLLPGDIVEEAIRLCKKTLADDTAKDPTRALKNLVDAFGAIGVKPEHLAEFLGHAVAECTAEEMGDLRDIGMGIKEGHTTWREVMATRSNPDDDKPPPAGGGAADKLKAKLAEKKAPPAAATAAPVAPATAPAAPATTVAQPAAGPAVTVAATVQPTVIPEQPEGSADDEDASSEPEPPIGALASDKAAPRNEAPKQTTIRTGGRR